MPEKRRSVCGELGLQFASLMRAVALEDRTAAEAAGIHMQKEENIATVTISEEAARMYFDPQTGNTLEFILNQISDHNCAEELRMIVTKIPSMGFIVIQKFKE